MQLGGQSSVYFLDYLRLDNLLLVGALRLYKGVWNHVSIAKEAIGCSCELRHRLILSRRLLGPDA